MPRKRNKIESAEKPTRAESVPGAEKPKRPKMTRKAAEERMRMHEENRYASMSEDEVFDEVLKAEDEVRDAEQALKEVKKNVFKKMKREPSAADRTQMEEVLARVEAAKQKLEELRPFAQKKMSEEHLSLLKEREIEQGLAEVQAELSKTVPAKKEPRKKSVGETFKSAFEAALAEAEQDPHRKQAAYDYKDLSKQLEGIERLIKKQTGHTAEAINMDSSLLGGRMGRFGRRIKNFFGRLAGTESNHQTVDDLMSRWKEVNAELEQLSAAIQPPTMTQITKEAKLMPKREETDSVRGRRVASVLEQRDLSKGAEAMMALVEASEDMETLLRELNSLSAETLLEKQPEFAEQLSGYRAELQAYETLAKGGDDVAAMFEETRGTLQRLEMVFNDTYEALAEQARTAGKGKARPKSRMPKTRRESSKGSYGTGAMERRSRVELHQGAGPKTELGISDEEHRIEVQKYRQEHAADIKVVMDEFKQAATVWDKTSREIATLEPETRTALADIFGTRDIATAYVLDVWFGGRDGDKAAQKRVIEANKLMGKFAGEQLTEQKSTEKPPGQRKKGGGSKKKTA